MSKRANTKIANSPVVRAIPRDVEDPSSSPLANLGFTPWCATSHESALSADPSLTLNKIPSWAEPTFPLGPGWKPPPFPSQGFVSVECFNPFCETVLFCPTS